MFHVVLCCSMLSCTILYYIVLHCIALCCDALYFIVDCVQIAGDTTSRFK